MFIFGAQVNKGFGLGHFMKLNYGKLVHSALLTAMLLGLLALVDSTAKAEVHEFMDLQAHGTMHIPWPFFAPALQWIPEGKKVKEGHKHLFRNVMHADYYKNNSATRIVINGAMVAERAITKKQTVRLMLKQIEYIDQFVQNNSEYFAVARTPEEVRHLVANTKKTIFIHSIEGGRKLLDGPEDAQFWASKGVAFVTLIHLLDDEYGHSAITPDGITPLINLGGTISRAVQKNKRRGLTEKGKKAIKWLADAGILTDLTHMALPSVDDALAVMEKEGIPPLHTHSFYQPLQNHDRGLSDEQLLRTYKLGGLFSTPIGGNNLFVYRPTDEGRKIVEQFQAEKGEICEDSLDNYVLTFNAVRNFLKTNQQEIAESSGKQQASELDIAIGWQSDFNGWVDHSKPKFGKKGCHQEKASGPVRKVDTVGLAHPGMLGEYWAALEEEGMHTESLRFASEKFLQMWEKVRARSQKLESKK